MLPTGVKALAQEMRLLLDKLRLDRGFRIECPFNLEMVFKNVRLCYYGVLPMGGPPIYLLKRKVVQRSITDDLYLCIISLAVRSGSTAPGVRNVFSKPLRPYFVFCKIRNTDRIIVPVRYRVMPARPIGTRSSSRRLPVPTTRQQTSSHLLVSFDIPRPRAQYHGPSVTGMPAAKASAPD